MNRRLLIIPAMALVAASLSACDGPATLYDTDAGFLQARTGAAAPTPIRVAASPGIDVAEVIRVWNKDAGRTFVVVDNVNPQVTFVGDLPATSRSAWVQPLPDRFGPYTACVIHYDPARLATELGTTGLQHEFGHCLGFRDIEFSPPQIRDDNQQCDAEDQPNHNGAALRMSYCYFWTPQLWGGKGDRNSLFQAGYGILDR